MSSDWIPFLTLLSIFTFFGVVALGIKYAMYLEYRPRIAPRVWEYGDGTRRYQPQLSDGQSLWKRPRSWPLKLRRYWWHKKSHDSDRPRLYRSELGARRKASRPQRKLDRTNLEEVKE